MGGAHPVNERLFRRYLHPMAPQPTGLPASGKPRGPIRALLCDVYGTLFISDSGDIGAPAEAAPEAALAAFMTEQGIRGEPRELPRRLRAAILERHAQRRAEGLAHPESRIEEIWMSLLKTRDRDRAREAALAYELMVNPVYPMPGLADLLRVCQAAALPLGIVSNAQFFTPLLFRWFLGASPEALGFAPDLTAYSFRLGAAKPSPLLLDSCLAGLQRRGLRPADALVLGNDMLNDILPAHRAGFQTALFAGDRRSLRLRADHPDCRRVAPDMVVTALDQIPPWLPDRERRP
jgi:putative hydrolase of the HAD superfamily